MQLFQYLKMKKIFLLLTLLCICFVTFSQETEEIKQATKDVKQTKVNEIKFSFQLPLFIIPTEISYERLLKNNIGLGVSAGMTFEQTVDPGEVMFFIMPYGRYYYKSIFIEANTILGYQYQDSSDPITVYGIGLAAGLKFSLGKNWFTEIFLGGGPLYGQSDCNLYIDPRGYDNVNCTPKVNYYYRIGFSFGKRF